MLLGAGTKLGAYEIRAELGRGGVGEVYRAWDPRLEREVALKILRERAEIDPDRVWRFVAEARAASALNHPNILAVFDAAVDGDTPYIVSELIEGDSLRGEVRRGPVPIRRLLDLATQIADGLADAHAAGIVHRDLKPENIMVTPGGRVKILDFGLARTTGLQAGGAIPSELDGQTQTASGLLIGTVPYMSPEQARGSPADFRSDQFSLGLILYEMAAGKPAFRRETPAQTLEAITNEEPSPLPDLNPQTPLMFWWIVERCLAKNPSDRYGATSDLHRDLRNVRDRFDALARERRTAEAVPPRRRALRSGLLAAAVLGSLAAGSLLVGSLGGAPASDRSTLRFRPLATDAGYEGLPAWSPDGQTIAYSAESNGVLQIFTRNLSAASPAQVTESAYDCKYPFWSPDGNRIYYISRAKTRDGVWSIGAAGGTPQIVLENAVRAALSPDGRTLAFLRDEEQAEIVAAGSVYLATPGGPEPWSSEEVAAAARRYGEFGDLRFVEAVLGFSRDGRSLAVMAVPFMAFPIDQRPDFRRWRFWVVPLAPAAAPRPRLVWLEDLIPRVTVSSLTWLPDNRHIVFDMQTLGTPGMHLWMVDVERDRAWPLTPSADSESFPSASPEGSRLVFTKGEPDFDIVQISTTGAPPQPVVSTARKETDPALSLDGSQMAYVTDRAGLDEIWIRSRTGPPLERPVITQRHFGDGQSGGLFSPAFSPNGQRLAYLRTGGQPFIALQIYLSSVAESPPVRLLPSSHLSFQSAPSWSPDGQWITFAEWIGRDRHWHLVKIRVGSNESPVVLRKDGVPNAAPQWSPKDDWITWETDDGFVLVSPDGKQERRLDVDQWLAHAWARDASSILGITETEDLRLSLIEVSARTGVTRTLADLGPSPPANNPVQGFSVGPDGRTILTSFVRMRGDLWLMEGLRRPETFWQRLWPDFGR